jgi:hypothetical protein
MIISSIILNLAFKFKTLINNYTATLITSFYIQLIEYTFNLSFNYYLGQYTFNLSINFFLG